MDSGFMDSGFMDSGLSALPSPGMTVARSAPAEAGALLNVRLSVLSLTAYSNIDFSRCTSPIRLAH